MGSLGADSRCRGVSELMESRLAVVGDGVWSFEIWVDVRDVEEGGGVAKGREAGETVDFR